GPDVASALRAGHLVGIPLAPTWLRTGAGDAPLAVARALTLAPIVPAAVRAVGRFGSIIGSWGVTFGPMVTLPDPYDPSEPLAAPGTQMRPPDRTTSRAWQRTRSR